MILTEAQTRLDAGLIPFAEAEEEYLRAQASNARYEAMLSEQKAKKNSNDAGNGSTMTNNDMTGVQVIKTTAQPRATAYVPDDELGLPVPFSQFAPFKPSQVFTRVQSKATRLSNNGTASEGKTTVSVTKRRAADSLSTTIAKP
uniref:Uncharacterized protein n=1 Tax=Lygus hesperus TaxID=30085 RepID=A0A0A9WZW4_LYGHE